MPNFLRCGLFFVLQQRIRSHDLAGDAESALHGAVFNKRILQWVKFELAVFVCGEAFDGGDLFAIGTFCGVRAGEYWLAIKNDSTGPAFSFVAAYLGSSQFETFTQ